MTGRTPTENATTVREVCFRCGSNASPETRQMRYGGQEWCNVCWDRKQDAPRQVIAALDALEAQAADRERLVARNDEAEAWLANETSRRVAAEAERDRLREQLEKLVTAVEAHKPECDRLAARVTELEAALRRVRTNARSWHGPELDNGHARALKVIAEWCDAALATDKEQALASDRTEEGGS